MKNILLLSLIFLVAFPAFAEVSYLQKARPFLTQLRGVSQLKPESRIYEGLTYSYELKIQIESKSCTEIFNEAAKAVDTVFDEFPDAKAGAETALWWCAGDGSDDSLEKKGNAARIVITAFDMSPDNTQDFQAILGSLNSKKVAGESIEMKKVLATTLTYLLYISLSENTLYQAPLVYLTYPNTSKAHFQLDQIENALKSGNQSEALNGLKSIYDPEEIKKIEGLLPQMKRFQLLAFTTLMVDLRGGREGVFGYLIQVNDEKRGPHGTIQQSLQ